MGRLGTRTRNRVGNRPTTRRRLASIKGTPPFRIAVIHFDKFGDNCDSRFCRDRPNLEISRGRTSAVQGTRTRLRAASEAERWGLAYPVTPAPSRIGGPLGGRSEVPAGGDG